MNKVLILGAIISIVLGSFIVKGLENEEVSEQTVLAENSLPSQIKSMGAVEVEVAPVNLIPGQKMLFNISLNTHSVDLGYNFMQIVIAVDNLGNEYEAQRWSGGEGGHHLKGDVVFEELSTEAESVKLILSGVGDQVSEFEWEL